MSTPQDYGLNHDAFRPHQENAIEQVLSMGGSTTLFLEAPTGSGKTAIARAVGGQESVTALCQTKMLQQSNYADAYGFDVLFGRANYRCALDPSVNAGLCEYAEIGMHSCPEAASCEYLLQKAKVQESSVRSLNYAYWMAARWPRQQMTDFLVLDEAHLLSDIILDRAGCTITDADRREWALPQFPPISTTQVGMLISGANDPHSQALQWLTSAHQIMQNHWTKFSKLAKGGDAGVKKTLQRCERLGWKVRATMDALNKCREEWYIISGARARAVGNTRQPGFVAKPLTAKHHFPSMFLDGHSTVAMSATIGDFSTFAEELGITEYSGLRIPNQWAAERRPVYYHPDAPKLGNASDQQAWDYQADLIVQMLAEVPPDWSGVIHTKSKSQMMALATRLAYRGLAGRVWPVPDKRLGRWLGTNEQLVLWDEQKKKTPGALMVACSMWEGVDLLDERIVIVAKLPFPYLGDPYEKERMQTNGRFYLQRTAWQLEQGLGRTRRGREQDYDTPTERRGLVAVLDNQWTRCKKYISTSLAEAIQAW